MHLHGGNEHRMPPYPLIEISLMVSLNHSSKLYQQRILLYVELVLNHLLQMVLPYSQLRILRIRDNIINFVTKDLIEAHNILIQNRIHINDPNVNNTVDEVDRLLTRLHAYSGTELANC